MSKEFDYGTLSWVKKEIDETLNQARQALEAFVEDRDDTRQLGYCVAHLHEVYGTLQIVELYGAALLAEEMEQIVKGVMTGEIRNADDAFEVLMRAILQLPDYLERLLTGHKDIPPGAVAAAQ
jgi:chemosensory pili system protein ChpA (sensor histidine kinase/response regulator)